MQIVPRSEITEQWDAFCAAHDAAWFWHTNAWLDYCLAYQDGNRDHSFGVLDGDRLIAICPVIQQGDEFNAGGDPLPWPISNAEGREWQRVSMVLAEETMRLAAEHQIVRYRFRKSPLTDTTPERFEGTTNVKDISFSSRVVDLTQGIEALHAGLSKSYQNDVNKVLRTTTIEIGSGDDIPVFLNRHIFCAGRQTRPTATWECMAEWLFKGDALLLKAMREGVPIGFTFINLYKGSAYYACAAYAERNIAKAVIWRAMLELKARGITQFELGWQGQATDAKGQGVEEFKRHFGGVDKPLVCAEMTWTSS